MDLYSGLPYWIAKNPLYNYYNPLQSDQETDVLIIGSGITGALVAHELCMAGIRCAVIDKRNISSGSSAASTALLQYEIDTPLVKLKEMIGEEKAVEAFRACLKSITDVETVFKIIGYDPDFKRVPSLYYASNGRGEKLIREEYKLRKKYDLPSRLLTKKEIKETFGFHSSCALYNEVSAQMDAYAAASHLIDYHRRRSELAVWSHTEVKECVKQEDQYQVMAANGCRIHCKYVVIAAGFEAGAFLPEKVMELTSTYAIISQPVDKQFLWHKHSLLWETKEPYLYIRTHGNRIIVGGEDENFKNPVLRDKLLRKKVAILEKKIHKLFPEIPFVTDLAWCGTFSTTKDGLPYIGNWPGDKNMLYALGYGGNGITFSMIAGQIIRNKIKGISDRREKIFGFERRGLFLY